MHIIRTMKHQIASISLLATILMSQSSIEAPTDTCKCGSAITVNGIVAYTGSIPCVEPNAHLIASISIIPATNRFGIGDNDSSDGTNTGSTYNYAGYDFTGDMQ
jgi:hypothetical protein